jgi:hypothetical protein
LQIVDCPISTPNRLHLILGWYTSNSVVHFSPRRAKNERRKRKVFDQVENRMESQLAGDQVARASSPSRWRQPLVRVCFLVSIAALLIFFGIVDIVFHQRPLLQIDRIVAEYLQQHTTRLGMRVMTFISSLAVPGVPALTVISALLLAYRRRWAELTLWVVAISGGLLLNSWLKQVYAAVRPPIADPLGLAFE